MADTGDFNKDEAELVNFWNKAWILSVTLWYTMIQIPPPCPCSKNKFCVQSRLKREGRGGWRCGGRKMREGVCRKVGEEYHYSLGNRLWQRNWEVFWLVLLSGREKRLPEGGYKKTKEAGGHVERLLKRSKHSFHNPTTATITTTRSRENKCTLRLRSQINRSIRLLLQRSDMRMQANMAGAAV